MGTIIMNIANNELLIFDFNKCLLDINKSINFFIDSPINTAVNNDLLFYPHFYTNKIEKAEKIIEELYHASRSAKTPFQNSKRAYLLACVKTFKGNYAESNDLLKEVKEIEKDKEGWGIGVLVLAAMNFIELENFEKAIRSIEKLKQLAAGKAAGKIVRKRNMLILEILEYLMESDGDFKKTLKNKLPLFNRLESNHTEYRWKIKSPELIIFHEWFRSKAESRPYNHLGAIQNEKEKYLLSIKGNANS